MQNLNSQTIRKLTELDNLLHSFKKEGLTKKMHVLNTNFKADMGDMIAEYTIGGEDEEVHYQSLIAPMNEKNLQIHIDGLKRQKEEIQGMVKEYHLDNIAYHSEGMTFDFGDKNGKEIPMLYFVRYSKNGSIFLFISYWNYQNDCVHFLGQDGIGDFPGTDEMFRTQNMELLGSVLYSKDYEAFEDYLNYFDTSIIIEDFNSRKI